MYMLFMGDRYYPAGGALDIAGIYPTLHDAKEAALALMGETHYDWWHVATVVDNKIHIIAHS